MGDDTATGKRAKKAPCRQQDCPLSVEFDPDDPRHKNAGALLVGEPRWDVTVYLRCENGHLNRYVF